jgi:hypothetical protein
MGGQAIDADSNNYHISIITISQWMIFIPFGAGMKE